MTDVDDRDVHGVVAQPGAGDVVCGPEAGGPREVATRAERDGRGITDVRLEAGAERVQPPQDLRVTAQQPGDQHREEHEHDGFDGDEHGHQEFPSRTMARSAGSESATSAANPAASATSARNGMPPSGWSATTASGRAPNAASAAATAAHALTTTWVPLAGAADAPRQPHGVSGARRHKRSAATVSTT